VKLCLLVILYNIPHLQKPHLTGITVYTMWRQNTAGTGYFFPSVGFRITVVG
jgi:hypothetical protein